MTNNEELARLIDSFRDLGRACWCEPGCDNTCRSRFSWKLGDLPEGYAHKYIYNHLGYNMKMTDMQAALGVSQLEKVETFIAARRKNHAFLADFFNKHGLDEHFLVQQATPGADPIWFGFLVTIRDGSFLSRDDVVQYLEEHKIGTRLLFAGNMTKQPAFKDVVYRISGDLDATDKIMNDSFWIGIWPGLGESELTYRAESIADMAHFFKDR